MLIPALGPENTKITEFLVDLTLPMPLFEQIFRKDSGKKGKKGKKGKGKGDVVITLSKYANLFRSC